MALFGLQGGKKEISGLEQGKTDEGQVHGWAEGPNAAIHGPIRLQANQVYPIGPHLHLRRSKI